MTKKMMILAVFLVALGLAVGCSKMNNPVAPLLSDEPALTADNSEDAIVTSDNQAYAAPQGKNDEDSDEASDGSSDEDGDGSSDEDGDDPEIDWLPGPGL